MDRKDGTESKRHRDSVSVVRPFARIRMVALLVLLTLALLILLARWLLG